jgi:hypothetical protein
VCTALSISRRNVLTKKTRSSDWADLRKSPPKADDSDLKEAIACVVKNRATYGYRRVWARLKIDGTVALKESDTRWCSYGLELSCDIGRTRQIRILTLTLKT